MTQLHLLSEVAPLEDVPEHRLVRGQVGTVVEVLSPAAVEVEFNDGEGRTHAMAALPLQHLVRLHHRQFGQAA